MVPRGQYDAVLIEEGHDFKPAWFKLIVQMVNPQRKGAKYAWTHDSVKIITMHSSKGLEFSLVGIPALGAALKEEEAVEDDARDA